MSQPRIQNEHTLTLMGYSSFSSMAQFRSLLKQHQLATGTCFVIRDSRSSYVTYKCVHNRRERRSDGRKTLHRTSDNKCPATIKITIDQMTNEIKLSKFVTDHNHRTFPDSPGIYLGNRCLTPAQKFRIYDLMDSFSNMVELRHYVNRKFGLAVKVSDLNTLRNIKHKFSYTTNSSDWVANTAGNNLFSNNWEIDGIDFPSIVDDVHLTEVKQIIRSITGIVLQMDGEWYQYAIARLQELLGELMNMPKVNVGLTIADGDLSNCPATSTNNLPPTAPITKKFHVKTPSAVALLPKPSSSKETKLTPAATAMLLQLPSTSIGNQLAPTALLSIKNAQPTTSVTTILLSPTTILPAASFRKAPFASLPNITIVPALSAFTQTQCISTPLTSITPAAVTSNRVQLTTPSTTSAILLAPMTSDLQTNAMLLPEPSVFEELQATSSATSHPPSATSKKRIRLTARASRLLISEPSTSEYVEHMPAVLKPPSAALNKARRRKALRTRRLLPASSASNEIPSTAPACLDKVPVTTASLSGRSTLSALLQSIPPMTLLKRKTEIKPDYILRDDVNESALSQDSPHHTNQPDEYYEPQYRKRKTPLKVN